MSNIDTVDVFDGGQQLEGAPNQNGFLLVKRTVDIAVSLMLLPLVLVLAACLFVLNPALNPGPVFFVQKRMGQGCSAIRVVKFRTMRPVSRVRRRANDPLEVGRIPRLGQLLRQTRLDEVPQILNVLKGEMSLIGPRPDYFPHALSYLRVIPGYRARHQVRPGISGLAQVKLGYAQGIDATRAKVAADLTYLRTRSLRLDGWIFLRTLGVVFRGGGR